MRRPSRKTWIAICRAALWDGLPVVVGMCSMIPAGALLPVLPGKALNGRIGSIAEEALAFDDLDDGCRDERLPGGVTGLDFSEHVRAANPQEVGVNLGHRLDETIGQEMLVKMAQVRGYGIGIGGDHLARFKVETGIHVKPGGILEKLAQTAQETAFALVVEAFVHDFFELGSAQGEAQRLIGVAGEI